MCNFELLTLNSKLIWGLPGLHWADPSTPLDEQVFTLAQYSMRDETLSIWLPPERVPIQHAADLVADLIGPDRLADEAVEAGVFRA